MEHIVLSVLHCTLSCRYNEKLKEKYGQHPQVSRIARHRQVISRRWKNEKVVILLQSFIQVPRHVKSAAQEIRSIKEAAKRKEANRRAHSKPGSVPYIPEREAHTVDEME